MKGITFKPENIRAIVKRSKTQTRRVIKPQPLDFEFNIKIGGHEGIRIRIHKGDRNPIYYTMDSFIKANARYQVGETIYIKETLFRHPYFNEAVYKLDNNAVFINQTIGDCLKWRWQRDILSPRFIPLEAARYFIKITDIRAERLQEITEEDAKAEGANIIRTIDNLQLLYPDVQGYRRGFLFMWDSIDLKYPWESNPWVFRYKFELTEVAK